MGIKKDLEFDREFKALNHIKIHHQHKVDAEKGFIALLQKDNMGFKQYHYKLSEITEEVIQKFLSGNFYFSQNTFWIPKRNVENIRQLRSLYVDIDCYNLKLTPEEVVYKLHLDFEGKFPTPNRIILSGRGVVPIWDIEPAPYMALPLWQIIIHYLVETLMPVGADPVATDAARIFRVAGSTNFKNGKEVEVLYIHEERKTLDFWRDTYLPQLNEYKEKKKQKKKTGRPKKIVSLYNAYSLHFARFNDLRRLVELRNGYMPKMRELTLFLYRYWSMDITKDEGQALQNALELNKRFWKPLSEKEVIKSTVSAEKMFHKKLDETAREEARKKGFPDAGYNYKNSSLIELLKITSEEQKELTTIIGREEKQRRDTLKKREIRGSVSREEYDQERKESKEHLLDMLRRHMEKNPKVKRKDLAELLGVSVYWIDKLKKELKSL